MGDNNVLITGTSRGIGKALKEAFEKKGDNVVGYKREDLGDIREMQTLGLLRQLAEDTNVNILINNAGIYSEHCLADTNLSEIYDIINVNLVAPILVTKCLWNILKKNNGTIVFINSVAGRVSEGGEIIYRVSKFGITGFSGSLLFEGKKDGIRIIDIPFGGVNTDMLKHRKGQWLAQQSPDEAAKLVVDIINSRNSSSIKHMLICGKIIDSFMG